MKKTMAIFALLMSLLIVLTGCRKNAPATQETQESAIAATEERESAETEPTETESTETEPAETESEAIGQYGNCTRCGVGIYDWNFMIESFDGLCSDCYLETLDPALICDNCGRDGSFVGMIEGLCEPCYWEIHSAETESEAIGQYGNCTRCGVGIYDWNFQIESFEGYCRDCYLETLDPALICDNCGRDGSFVGMMEGLCEPCYWEVHTNTDDFCANCGRGAIPLNENGLCEACANGACVWCGGPVSDSHNCDDYPNVNCPNCDWGMFTTGVGIDGIICPVCGTRVV